MPKGIRDRVAILGMGCAKFGERWDSDGESLMLEAFGEALADAGFGAEMIDAAWLSVGFDALNVGPSGLPAATALGLDTIPVTKVENYCASGTDAFRGAAYAVASGASDIALAIGVEKLKDTGYGGLPVRTRGTRFDHFGVTGSAPGNFAQLAMAYSAKHHVDRTALKEAMAHISVKSHANAVNNPKAHLRKAINVQQVLDAPIIAEPLGLFDCCGVSDGAACALVATPEMAHELGLTRARDGQGPPDRRIQRLGTVELGVGRQLSEHDASGRAARIRGGHDRRSRFGAGPDRGSRLLLDHRAGHDGGSATER